MKKYSEITLVYEKVSRDSIGQYITTESSRIVPCEVGQITRQEWSMAGQRGFAPTCTAIVFESNYQNETTAILEGEKYKIYRSFKRNDEQIELYLEKATGA